MDATISSRRLNFVVVASAFAVAMVGTTLPTPLYVLYRDEFGFSSFLVTVIFATYAVGVIVALLAFGRASDEFGRRPLLFVGLVLSAGSAVAFLLAHGIALLFVGRLVSGLSAGIVTGTATATLLDLAPEGGQARATLVSTLVNMVGLGIGPLLAGVVSETFGSPLRKVFVVDLVLLAAAALAMTTVREPGQVADRPRLRPQVLQVPPEVRPTFVPAALAAFAGFAVLGLFTALAPAVLGQLLAVKDRSVVGLVVFGVFAGSALGEVALEWVDERAQTIGCMLLALGAAVLGLGVGVGSLGVFVAGGLLAGVGQGMSFRAGLAAVNRAAPEGHRGEVASSFFVVAYVALAIPVVGVGVLELAAGLRTAGVIFAGAVTSLSLATIALLARHRQPANA